MTPARSPLIGLTTYREPAAWAVWHEPADLLPVSYADAIVAAGAIAVLLPPACFADLDAAADEALHAMHGLVLCGGADVDPQRYHADRDPRTGPARPDRDGWELALAHAAILRDLPVLAICRGMQVLNVALGGTLLQHLPDSVGHDGHCPTKGVHGRHLVELSSTSRIGSLLGASCEVATYHHQGLDRLGDDLQATGWSLDGTVESVEHTRRQWVVGVQWHPEVAKAAPGADGAELFSGFIRACVSRRDDRQLAPAQGRS
ncbi:MAG: gamma-glutamyl-gamma-aminobutyrate hydrolase family protein [Actinomycetota bacterium]|nr:gamma-glutamyl-gamma-aminobutyrate hydrolase family protein [Actinomycetota bacterium]